MNGGIRPSKKAQGDSPSQAQLLGCALFALIIVCLTAVAITLIVMLVD